jgi:acyl-coenzyme A synthetase/AMP-(fatty) acid ligase
MSVVDRILWQAHYSGDAPALSVPGPYRDVVTYARLRRHVANACSRLAPMGVVPGSVYGLHMTDNLLYIVLILALERLGAGSVTIPRMEQVAGWPLAGILYEGEPVATSVRIEKVDLSWLEGDGRFDLDAPGPKVRPNDVCHIAWTSGSTGKPKGVVQTHATMTERISMMGYRVNHAFSRQERLLSALGFASSFGYLLLIHTLARGGMYCLSGPAMDEAARKIAMYNIRTLVASPMTLAEFTRASRTERRDFQALEMAISSGGALRRQLAEGIRAQVCSRLMISYGSAEAGAITNSFIDDLDLDKGEVGFVLPGVEVEIVDPVTREPVKDGIGRVLVRSKSVADRYFEAEGRDEQIAENGAWLTDDLGFISPKGVLAIHGRDSHVVNLGGPKTTLEVIEASYAAAPGVAEIASMLLRDNQGLDRLIAFVVPDEDWSEQRFWDHCRKAISPEHWPARLIISKRLPRSAGGKVDRQQLPALV